MISLTTITEKVNTAKLYYQTLIDDYRASFLKGCENKPKYLDCLRWTISALSADIRDTINTDKTQKVYAKLLDILGGYSEIYVVDPNVIIPNTTFIVEGNGMSPIFITDADFTGNEYLNPALVGMTNYVVFDQNLNRYLTSSQFTYIPTGGIEITDGIYGGESFVLIF